MLLSYARNSNWKFRTPRVPLATGPMASRNIRQAANQAQRATPALVRSQSPVRASGLAQGRAALPSLQGTQHQSNGGSAPSLPQPQHPRMSAFQPLTVPERHLRILIDAREAEQKNPRLALSSKLREHYNKISTDLSRVPGPNTVVGMDPNYPYDTASAFSAVGTKLYSIDAHVPRVQLELNKGKLHESLEKLKTIIGIERDKLIGVDMGKLERDIDKMMALLDDSGEAVEFDNCSD